MEFVELNNGLKMPSLGIGTFLLEPKVAYESVLASIKDGYSLIDTANMYNNEVSVGRAIKDSGVAREKIFLSTKLWPSEYGNPNAVEETLKRLGLDYVDLLFIHQPTDNWREGYKQLIKAYESGFIKAIGVSNFEGGYIQDLLKEFDVRPQIIQVECHPYFPQDELRKVVGPEGIKIMSWYPLGGKGKTKELLENRIILDLARKHGKSSAQILLRWHVQMGFVVIPGSGNPEHIKDNIDIFDFELSEEDMDKIASLNNGQRHHVHSKENLKRYSTIKPIYEKKDNA